MRQEATATITAIRDSVSIFLVLEKLGVKFPMGHHTQQIKCPFHTDSTPSARIYEDTNRLYCFTCHELWDIFSLVQKKMEVPFWEAVEWLQRSFDVKSVDILSLVQSLTSTITEQDITPTVSMLENLVKQHKQHLGLYPSAKLFQAIDTITYQFHSKTLSMEEFQIRVSKIQEALSRRLSAPPQSEVCEM